MGQSTSIFLRLRSKRDVFLVQGVNVGIFGQDPRVFDSPEDDGDHVEPVLHGGPDEVGVVVLADVGLEDEQKFVVGVEVGDAVAQGRPGAGGAALAVHVDADLGLHL